MTDGEASGGDGRRPGWAGLFWATVVVLVVGGFALSRSYGVQEVSSGTLPPVPPVSSTSTTTAPLVTDTTPLESVDAVYDEWMYQVTDVAVAQGGSVYVAAPVGVAWLDGAGEWTLLDIDSLPVGTGTDYGLPGRIITQVAASPSTDGWTGVWFFGSARSHADDEQFGGYIDGWSGGRVLEWVASYHCPFCGEWTVWTTNEVPELIGDIGDLVVSSDGIVYASMGENLLMMFDGQAWTSFEVPLPAGGSGVSYPWSSSLAVGTDGVVWAGSNYDYGGVLRFDGIGFTRYTTDDGLPSDHAFQVVAGADGTIWVATDVLYGDVGTASPDEAAGVAAFDGTTWTTYTMSDGLLSNDAVIAAGSDGTVWAVHYEIPPYGYSRFDGTGWTSYPFDGPVGGWRAEVAPDGTLWTISDGGLISFDGTTRTIHPTPFVQPSALGTITVSVDGLEGFEDLAVDAWVVPIDPTDESQPLGETSFWPIDEDPFSASQVMQTPDGFNRREFATFEPGAYRFIIEAYVPSGNMRYGCEMPIQVVEGEPLVVTFTSIPTYTGDGIHWTPLDELEYPDCPN